MRSIPVRPVNATLLVSFRFITYCTFVFIFSTSTLSFGLANARSISVPSNPTNTRPGYVHYDVVCEVNNDNCHLLKSRLLDKYQDDLPVIPSLSASSSGGFTTPTFRTAPGPVMTQTLSWPISLPFIPEAATSLPVSSTLSPSTRSTLSTASLRASTSDTAVVTAPATAATVTSDVTRTTHHGHTTTMLPTTESPDAPCPTSFTTASLSASLVTTLLPSSASVAASPRSTSLFALSFSTSAVTSTVSSSPSTSVIETPTTMVSSSSSFTSPASLTTSSSDSLGSTMSPLTPTSLTNSPTVSVSGSSIGASTITTTTSSSPSIATSMFSFSTSLTPVTTLAINSIPSSTPTSAIAQPAQSAQTHLSASLIAVIAMLSFLGLLSLGLGAFVYSRTRRNRTAGRESFSSRDVENGYGNNVWGQSRAPLMANGIPSSHLSISSEFMVRNNGLRPPTRPRNPYEGIVPPDTPLIPDFG